MKPVLVTGGTRGLGLSISSRLVQEGFRVIAAGRQMSAELDELQRNSGDSVEFMPLDLEQHATISDFARSVADQFGRIYGLVNNAGVGMDGILGTMHNADIARVMAINITGPMILTKYISRSMMLAKEGRIVNMSSIIARTGFSGLSAYAATKAALEGFTRSLAREIGRTGITVNAVAPGFMQTAMTNSLQGQKFAAILRRSPLGRLASTEDVAAAVSFLLGTEAASITGTIITVDAGSTA